jgi:uncharacterized protein (TIGR03546 family)
LKRKIKESLIHLLRLHSTPYEIALGVAIGVFISTLPLYGFHTFLVILAAVIVRPANKIAILLGTNFSLPPTVPFITWAGYEIGRAVLGKGKYPPLEWSQFKHINLQKVLDLYPPLFLGSVILGIICAVFFYFIVFLIAKKLKDRKAHHTQIKRQ